MNEMNSPIRVVIVIVVINSFLRGKQQNANGQPLKSCARSANSRPALRPYAPGRPGVCGTRIDSGRTGAYRHGTARPLYFPDLQRKPLGNEGLSCLGGRGGPLETPHLPHPDFPPMRPRG